MEEPAVSDREHHRESLGRDLFMVFLAIVSIGILIYDEVAVVPADERLGLIVIDAGIVLLFAIEFGYGLWTAQNRKAYWKSHWYELPGLVPMAVGEASFLRVFRILRVIRVFRILRVVSVIARLRRANRIAKSFVGRSHILTIATLGATLILMCAYLEFLFEKDSSTGHFQSFWDALWWAIVTTTTVGYGDKFPITVGGKIVAIVLMFTGIGTIGVLAGSLANALIKSPSDPGPTGTSIDERLATLAELHSKGQLTDQEFGAAKTKLLGEP